MLRPEREALDHTAQSLRGLPAPSAEIANYQGLWSTLKQDYKGGILVYRPTIDLAKLESLSSVRPGLVIVDLLVPQFHGFNTPAETHPLFKCQIAAIGGPISADLLQDAMLYRLDDYLSRVHGEWLPMDAKADGRHTLKILPFIQRSRLFEMIHTLRQYLLSYLQCDACLQYRLHDTYHSQKLATPDHRIYLPESTLGYGASCTGHAGIRRAISKRAQAMARELLYPSQDTRTRKLDEISLNVDVPPSDWQFLVSNSFLLPREQVLKVGPVELRCEVTSGPPGALNNPTADTTQDHVGRLATSTAPTFQPSVGDIVIRQEEAAVILHVDNSLSPPAYVLHMIRCGTEVSCERSNFMAKGDLTLSQAIQHSMP
jgi:hypothetical protein